MRNIHPEFYYDAVVICACGNSWTTGSTVKEIRTDVCSQCHPFYTGEQRIVDSEGQVDRFYKRLQARQEYLDERKARAEAQTSPDRPMSEIDLSKRAVDALAAADIHTAGEFLEKLAQGEQAVLDIDGFGRKSLADARKRLRQLGYEIPDTEIVA